MYHGSNTRNVVVNHAEEPDWIPHPELDPIGYDHNNHYRHERRRRRVNWRLCVVGGLLLIAPLVISCLMIRSFLIFKYDYDQTFRLVVDAGLNLATAAFFVALAGTAIVVLGWLFNLAAKAGLIELPGGMIAHVFDVILDWRRSGSQGLAKWSMKRHFAVQTVLANKSLYRNVTTFSPTRAITYDADIDLEESDRKLIPQTIPSFSDLVETGKVGGNNGMMLGIADEEEI